MNRRKFLAAFGTVSAASIAGCSGEDGGAEEPEVESSGNSTPETETEQTEEEIGDETEDETDEGDDAETIVLEGSGDETTEWFELEGGFTTAQVDYEGDGPVVVEVHDEDGEHARFEVDDADSWAEEYGTYAPAGEYKLVIEAEGDWTITITQYGTLGEGTYAPPVEFSDDANNVFGPIRYGGEVTVDAEHRGEGDFTVAALRADGEKQKLLFDETGEFSGSVTFAPEEYGWIAVEAEGEYAIEVTEA